MLKRNPLSYSAQSTYCTVIRFLVHCDGIFLFAPEDLRAFLHSSLSLIPHMSRVSKSCQLSFKLYSESEYFISAAAILLQAIVISYVDTAIAN